MNILVFSDTHGNVDNVNKLLKHNNYDYIFFLGDGLSDLGTLLNVDNVYAVKGNCDFISSHVLEQIISIEGYKFLAVHGHTYNVKSGLGGLVSYAKECSADIVLYGHTHKSLHTIIDNVVVINPGALSFTRGGKQTYAVINIVNKNFEVKILEL